jgi:hypothetical protein
MMFAPERDARLPQLREVLDARAMERRLSDALDREVRISGMAVAKHKPGRRCVVRFDLGGEPRALYAKAFYNDRGAKVYERSWALERAVAHSGNGPRLPRTLAYLPDMRLLVQEAAPGLDLGEYLLRTPRARKRERALRRVARSLAALHSLKLRLDTRHGPERELQPLDRFLPRLCERHPQLQAEVAGLREACRRELGGLSPGWQYVPIHRDFYHTQVVVEGEPPVVRLIDFDELCLGEPAIDVGNLTGHLVLLGLQSGGDPDRFGGEILAFADQYAALRPMPRARIAAFEAATLLRLAGIHGAGDPNLARSLLALSRDRLERLAVSESVRNGKVRSR